MATNAAAAAAAVVVDLANNRLNGNSPRRPQVVLSWDIDDHRWKRHDEDGRRVVVSMVRDVQ